MNGEWRARAECRSVEPETFFPTADTGPVYEAQVAVAKAVCARCPVRDECLAEALVRIPFGIAGGLTPEERRGRRPAAAGREVAVLDAGLRPGASRVDVEAAGRVLLTAGRPVVEVAHRCGVTARTVTRWISKAEGSRGCNRAPLLISHTHCPQAGTPTQEGIDRR